MEFPSLKQISYADSEQLEKWYRWLVPRTQDEEAILEGLTIRAAKMGVFNEGFHRRSRRATAIHEAGHTVVATKLDVLVTLVKVVSNEEGFCEYSSHAKSETELENHIVCSLAGQWAEARLASQLRAFRRLCSKTDDERVVELLDQMHAGRSITTEQKYSELSERAVEMVEQHQSDILRVAEELLLVGELNGARIKELT